MSVPAAFRYALVLPFVLALRYEKPLYFAFVAAGLVVWFLGGPFSATVVLLVAAMVVSSVAVGAAIERSSGGNRRR